MIVRISFTFDRETVRMQLAHPPVVLSEANAVALTRSQRQLVAVGDAAESRRAGDVEYLRAYDPGAFDADVTAAFIRYCQLVMYQAVRPSLLRGLIPGFFDRFELDLILPGLDALGTDARRRLSSALGVVHARAKITVNGQRLKRR